jgi:hypothetical protein
MSTCCRASLGLLAAALLLAGADPAPVQAALPQAVSQAVAPAADTLRPVLRGRVRASGFRNGEGLPGAIVEVRQQDRRLEVTTDADGYYRVTGVRPGRSRLRVFHIAATPFELEVSVPGRGAVEVDITLERRVLSLPPVVVRTAGRIPASVRPSVSVLPPGARGARLHMPALAATSGLAESGIGGLTAPPGGEEPGEPGQVLYMRGSTVDSRQVLLDGAPILTPFHLAGLLPSFDAGILGAADLHLGGAPARYDGGLSYILDVATREPRTDRVRGEVAADPVAGRIGLELPLGGSAGFLGLARGIHALGAGADFPYRYSDALARFAMRPGKGQTLGVTGFQNREGVHLGPLGARSLSPTHDLASWGNRALSVRWSRLGSGHRIEAGAAATRYEASLPLVWTDPVLARTRAERVRGEISVSHPHLRWGASAERQDFGWELVALAEDVPSETPGRSASRRADRAGGFAEFEIPAGRTLSLRGGVRGDWFGVDRRFRVAPRASARLQLTEAAWLTLSAGRFHETLPVSSLATQGDTPEEARLFWAPSLAVSSASHVVLSLDQDLAPELHLEVAGYAKHFQGPGRPVRASGTDLRVTRAGEVFEGWVGYALTWVWSASSAGAAGEAREFAGRHLLSAGARVRPGGDLALGVTVGYGAGLPLTGVALPTGPEGFTTVETTSQVDRLVNSTGQDPLGVAVEDDFLRLDLEASWQLTATLAGRETELRPYLRILNALDRRDALFHYFDRWRDEELRPIATRPFLPLVGVEWRF